MSVPIHMEWVGIEVDGDRSGWAGEEMVLDEKIQLVSIALDVIRLGMMAVALYVLVAWAISDGDW